MILRPVSDKSAKSDEKSKKDLTRGHIITVYIENHFEFKKTKISLVNHIQKGSSQKGMNQNLESIYHQIFFCGGILSITNRWIIRGKKETPEQMAEILENEWGSALFQTL